MRPVSYLGNPVDWTFLRNVQEHASVLRARSLRDLRTGLDIATSPGTAYLHSPRWAFLCDSQFCPRVTIFGYAKHLCALPPDRRQGVPAETGPASIILGDLDLRPFQLLSFDSL